MARSTDDDKWNNLFDDSLQVSYGSDFGRSARRPTPTPHQMQVPSFQPTGVTVGMVVSRLADETAFIDRTGAIAALLLALANAAVDSETVPTTPQQVHALAISQTGQVAPGSIIVPSEVAIGRLLRQCVNELVIPSQIARIIHSRIPMSKQKLTQSLAQLASVQELRTCWEKQEVSTSLRPMVEAPFKTSAQTAPHSRRDQPRSMKVDELFEEDKKRDWAKSGAIFALAALSVGFVGSLALAASRDAHAEPAPTWTEVVATADPMTEAVTAEVESQRGDISIPTPTRSESDQSISVVLREELAVLDELRSQALAERSLKLLTQVDAPNSSAMAADVDVINKLKEANAKLVGGDTTITSIVVSESSADEATVEVLDERASYQIVNTATGAVLAQEPVREKQWWQVKLVRLKGNWLIASSEPLARE